MGFCAAARNLAIGQTTNRSHLAAAGLRSRRDWKLYSDVTETSDLMHELGTSTFHGAVAGR